MDDHDPLHAVAAPAEVQPQELISRLLRQLALAGVGVNMPALTEACKTTALAQLLVAKGIIAEEEYTAAVQRVLIQTLTQLAEHAPHQATALQMLQQRRGGVA